VLEPLSSVERQRTPDHLIRTAERLYAAEGIDAVSLRQIVTAAGHRNPAAVQYHFGSRDGLLRAIIEYRLPTINDRRLALLDRLAAEGRPHDPRGIVEAMALPLLEQEPPESHYVGFLARFHSHRSEIRDAFDSLGDVGLSGRRIGQAMNVITADLPPPVAANRREMVLDLMLVTIAARQERQTNGDDDGMTTDVFGSALIDGLVALLTAPHTGTVADGAA
jgi:AcrR family transcriptional regulator